MVLLSHEICCLMTVFAGGSSQFEQQTYCIEHECHSHVSHHITLHYTTLHYVTLHYITSHYVTLRTLHYITLHHITSHYLTLHYVTLHYIMLRYITLHYIMWPHQTCIKLLNTKVQQPIAISMAPSVRPASETEIQLANDVASCAVAAVTSVSIPPTPSFSVSWNALTVSSLCMIWFGLMDVACADAQQGAAAGGGHRG